MTLSLDKLYSNALSLTRLRRELGTEQYSQSEFAPSEARRPSRRETLDVRNFRGMGFSLCLCNTKAKLAIKQNSNKDVENGGAYEEKYMD